MADLHDRRDLSSRRRVNDQEWLLSVPGFVGGPVGAGVLGYFVRGGGDIFFADDGDEVCPCCFEVYWCDVEAWFCDGREWCGGCWLEVRWVLGTEVVCERAGS